MGFIRSLFHSDINPSNHKSRTLPALNIKDKYGRTFHLSWMGFFVAFLSWFAFPPLLHGVIQQDLQLTHAQIANSNIMALLATLLVRFVVGPLCDKYGPRYVMAGCLLVGAIPTALTPMITNASGLIIVRFFLGILGGTFVPCQVWTSQFFDRNIIGFANALAAGFGNAGGGAAFFLMPTVVSSLMNNHGVSQYWAWRLAFPFCPLVIIVGVSAMILIFGHDTPTGAWSARLSKRDATSLDDGNLGKKELVEDTDKRIEMADTLSEFKSADENVTSILQTPLMTNAVEESKELTSLQITTSGNEIRQAPSMRDVWKTTLSTQTLLVALPYLCSFGAELAIEGIISDFYIQTAKIQNNVVWDYRMAGNWAAVFGLLNIAARPFGGYMSDVVYQCGSVNSKKWWLIFLGVMQGVFLISIGFAKFGIYSLIVAMTGAAIFMDAANGAIFGLVPDIHPKFNGIVSGVVGASGNIGGVMFSLVFRFFGPDYLRALWIIGIFCFSANLSVTIISIRSSKKKEPA